MKITNVTITPMPRPIPQGMFDPMPEVIATFEDGSIKTLFAFYPDEVSFRASEFVGLTEEDIIELPVLFYVACGLALTTRTVDIVFLTVAAAFVLARIAHAAIHIGPNVVIWRFRAFAAGLFLLVAMWGILAWRIAISGF